MAYWLERTQRILGEGSLQKLSQATVAVLGLGGAGSAAAEALARSGIGHLILVDDDCVEETNLNRQLLSTTAVLGKEKALVMRDRLLAIHPEGDYRPFVERLLPDHADFLFDCHPDFIVDAIDMVTAKLFLAEKCRDLEIPLLTCLGTGNRLDPSQLKVGDLSETAGCGCPLARVMRRELHKRGIDHLPVVYSTEMPLKPDSSPETNGRHSPGSSAFVPPSAGFLMASYVVRYLLRP